MRDLYSKFLKIWNSDGYVKPFIYSVLSSMACVFFLELSTANIFALLFLFSFYFLYKQSFAFKDKRTNLVSKIIAAFYTVSFSLYKFDDTMSKEGFARVIVMAFYLIGFYLLFSNIINLLYNKLLNTSFICEKNEYKPKRAVILFLLSMLIMILFWLPYFLRNFPGDITTDSNNQLLQAVGKISYSNAHPVIHTMFVKLFYNLGLKLFGGDQTLAVATYSFCQMILLSAAFSYLIVSLYKFKVKKIVIIGVLSLFALVPYHAIYSVTLWKDIWFAAIVLIFSTVIWQILEYYREENNKFPWLYTVLMFVFGLALCLFRSNGLYAYVVLVPFIFLIFRKKNLLIAVLAVLVLPLAFVVKGPMMQSLNIPQSDIIESLSIPAQQIARSVVDGANLTAEQYDLLSEVVVIEEIPEKYTPHVSDPIKNLVRKTDNQSFITKHKGEFLKLWIKVGLANPRSYINALIDQTYGYWYPDVQYWVYAPEFINRDMEYVKDTKLSENAYEFYSKVMQSYKRIPFWGLLWSIGTFTWTALFSMGLCFLKKDKQFLVVYIPVLAILATLMIATPVYSEFRYAYSLFTTLPLLFVIPFLNKPKAETTVLKS